MLLEKVCLHKLYTNVIWIKQVALETEKEKEIEKQVSDKENCPTELDNTSTPDQKELENEVSKKKTITQILFIY